MSFCDGILSLIEVRLSVQKVENAQNEGVWGQFLCLGVFGCGLYGGGVVRLEG